MNFCIFYQVNLTGSGLFKLDCRRNRLQGIGLKETGTFLFFLNPKIPQVSSSPTQLTH